MGKIDIFIISIAILGSLIGIIYLRYYKALSNNRMPIMLIMVAIAVTIITISSKYFKNTASETAVTTAIHKSQSMEADRYLSDGIEYASRGRLSDAITAYKKAIEINPSSANAYQYLGYALLRRSQIMPGLYPSDLKDSVSALEKAVLLDPNHIWAHYNLSLAYLTAGKKEMAMDNIRRVIQLDPSFRGVISNDTQFNAFKDLSEFRNLIYSPKP